VAVYVIAHSHIFVRDHEMTVAEGIARKSDIERIAEKLKQLSQAILLGRHATYHGDFEPLRDALHDLGVYRLWRLCVPSISFCGN